MFDLKLKELALKEILKAEIIGECIVCTTRVPSSNGHIYVCYKSKVIPLHRLIICILKNIPLDIKFDFHHTCEQKRCINENHIELLSKSIHSRLHKKKRFCKRGHDTLITGRYKNGQCRICNKRF